LVMPTTQHSADIKPYYRLTTNGEGWRMIEAAERFFVREVA
jgi:hypothetical protein